MNPDVCVELLLVHQKGFYSLKLIKFYTFKRVCRSFVAPEESERRTR